MADNEMKDDVPYIAPYDQTKTKKKKKSVPQDLAEDKPVDNLVEKTGSLFVSDSAKPSFAGFKKKKKKAAHADLLNEEKENLYEDSEVMIGEDEKGEGIVLQQYTWEESDKNYQYEELLGRVFNILHECCFMHRQPEHVQPYLLGEMGTSRSLDGQQKLVVKGRFAPKNFEGILQSYINDYVICDGCKCSDTILSKENRLFFLRCEKCGSGRSVAQIKAGFVARVGRRKAET